MSGPTGPPALPPRAGSVNMAAQTETLPAYTELDTGPYASLASDDPRSSSTQSLRPEDTPQHDDRRTLLLVYIHGFMGTETSFQSFPLHVHRYLTLLLADSHVVHTKIYPRYKSKRQIQFARDDFSRWLTPHESPETDVVLLGHSMGGLLAAEVALMPATPPAPSSALKHCILGTINFDVPFLGMHPGVVSTGLASLFRGKSPERKPEHGSGEGSLNSPSVTTLDSVDSAQLSPVTSNASSSSQPPKWINSLLAQTDNLDPNFNPRFNNDVNLPMRKGWNKALHFINKHSDNLIKSSQNLVKSHMEFGGAMADYSGLKARYNRLRMLEDDSEDERRGAMKGTTQRVPRVRFVNYYTASTGRPKKTPAAEATSDEVRGRPATPSPHELATSNTRTTSRSKSPRISVEEVRNTGEVVPKDASIPQTPKTDDDDDDNVSESSLEIPEDASGLDVNKAMSVLPPIPPEPRQPEPIDLSSYEDFLTRKVAQRQYNREVKAYRQALRHRKATLKDRSKLVTGSESKPPLEKGKDSVHPDLATITHEHDAGPSTILRPVGDVDDRADQEDILARYRSAEAAAMASHHDNVPLQASTTSDADIHTPTLPSDETDMSLTTVPSVDNASASQSTQPKKDRKFCMLPRKNAQGQRDPTWVRIFMKDIDEVAAHCGLFMQDSETYETLVGEVGQRLEDWVREDMSRRAVECH